MRAIFATHGVPRVVVSDNGPCFIAQKFESFLEINGVKHSLSAPYHPPTNGLAARAVQTVKQESQDREETETWETVCLSFFCSTGWPHKVPLEQAWVKCWWDGGFRHAWIKFSPIALSMLRATESTSGSTWRQYSGKELQAWPADFCAPANMDTRFCIRSHRSSRIHVPNRRWCATMPCGSDDASLGAIRKPSLEKATWAARKVRSNRNTSARSKSSRDGAGKGGHRSLSPAASQQVNRWSRDGRDVRHYWSTITERDNTTSFRKSATCIRETNLLSDVWWRRDRRKQKKLRSSVFLFCFFFW